MRKESLMRVYCVWINEGVSCFESLKQDKIHSILFDWRRKWKIHSPQPTPYTRYYLSYLRPLYDLMNEGTYFFLNLFIVCRKERWIRVNSWAPSLFFHGKQTKTQLSTSKMNSTDFTLSLFYSPASTLRKTHSTEPELLHRRVSPWMKDSRLILVHWKERQKINST